MNPINGDIFARSNHNSMVIKIKKDMHLLCPNGYNLQASDDIDIRHIFY